MTGQMLTSRVPSAVECVPYEGQRATLGILGGPFFLLALACSCSADIPDGTFACERDGQCPPGMICGDDQLCWRRLPASDAAVEADAPATVDGGTVVDAGTDARDTDSGLEPDGGAPIDAGLGYTVAVGPTGPGGLSCNLDGIWERGGTMAGLATTSASTMDPLFAGAGYVTGCIIVDLGELRPLTSVLVSVRGSGAGVAVCGETCEDVGCTADPAKLVFGISQDGSTFFDGRGPGDVHELRDNVYSLSAIARYIGLCRAGSPSGGMLEIDYIEIM